MGLMLLKLQTLFLLKQLQKKIIEGNLADQTRQSTMPGSRCAAFSRDLRA